MATKTFFDALVHRFLLSWGELRKMSGQQLRQALNGFFLGTS